MEETQQRLSHFRLARRPVPSSQAQTGIVSVNATTVSATGLPSTFITSTTTSMSGQTLNNTGLSSALESGPGSISSAPFITGFATIQDDQNHQNGPTTDGPTANNYGRRDLKDDTPEVLPGEKPGLRNWQQFARQLVAGPDW
ncbi:hypothetical protein NUW58_g9244 [Xylaria curta]|uniref:Uncharacterized protein n=1 Tax=Xylaria curta TaxID=42375 RepID=A0ACC1MZY3_9PEZI|nr:hypothetical protein NUW58_g9244 [Xylaria curta]